MEFGEVNGTVFSVSSETLQGRSKSVASCKVDSVLASLKEGYRQSATREDGER